jgi:hypothetical protein
MQSGSLLFKKELNCDWALVLNVYSLQTVPLPGIIPCCEKFIQL